MRRRELIVGIGIAVAWWLAVNAQQPDPVVGFLGSASPCLNSFRYAGLAADIPYFRLILAA